MTLSWTWPTIKYRDRSVKNENVIRKRHKLTNDEVIFSTELSLEINDLKQIDEEINYTLG